MARCADSNCGYYWKEEWEEFHSCKADPNWPAPCEYDEEEDYDEN